LVIDIVTVTCYNTYREDKKMKTWVIWNEVSEKMEMKPVSKKSLCIWKCKEMNGKYFEKYGIRPLVVKVVSEQK